jgi:hypothetical protein
MSKKAFRIFLAVWVGIVCLTGVLAYKALAADTPGAIYITLPIDHNVTNTGIVVRMHSGERRPLRIKPTLGGTTFSLTSPAYQYYIYLTNSSGAKVTSSIMTVNTPVSGYLCWLPGAADIKTSITRGAIVMTTPGATTKIISGAFTVEVPAASY